ncbi:MAG: GNAT family protein [Candidatus Paceibacterota bacterium]
MVTVEFTVTLNKSESKEILMFQALQTPRLILRPTEEKDLVLLAEWESTEDYREFVSASKIKYHLRFLICARKGKKPVGVLYTFSYNKTDGFVFLNVFLEKKYRRIGYGAEACILAICYLFDNFPIYKIYCDAFSSNTQSIAMMRSAGLEQEGFLRGHRFYNGMRYDVIRFAVHQSNLVVLKQLLQKFMSRKIRT